MLRTAKEWGRESRAYGGERHASVCPLSPGLGARGSRVGSPGLIEEPCGVQAFPAVWSEECVSVGLDCRHCVPASA